MFRRSKRKTQVDAASDVKPDVKPDIKPDTKPDTSPPPYATDAGPRRADAPPEPLTMHASFSTPGDVLLACRDGAVWTGFNVRSAILVLSLAYFSALRPLPPVLILDTTPSDMLLLLRFLYAGETRFRHTPLRPSQAKLAHLHRLLARFEARGDQYTLLTMAAARVAPDLVSALGPTPDTEAVWTLLRLANTLKSVDIWLAAQTAPRCPGWDVIHDPWSLSVEDMGADVDLLRAGFALARVKATATRGLYGDWHPDFGMGVNGGSGWFYVWQCEMPDL